MNWTAIIHWIMISAAVAAILYVLYIVIFFIWYVSNAKGVAYFGRPIADRRKFKRKIYRYGRFARPLMGFLGPKLAKAGIFEFSYQGFKAPSLSCSPRAFRKAVQYRPQSRDLFIVSQMKCGTSWMLQIAYEILSRGKGDLSDNGHYHLGAMSPWIESFNSVSMEKAPLIGDKGMRIIKTHLPASLCPYNEDAKYIYITRHPVSCFASVVDFIKTLYGPFTPEPGEILKWFCSDNMWWGCWPDHVAGYWQLAQKKSNVLFFHFEELKQDLSAVIRRIAAFSGCPLTEDEISEIMHKCDFGYMKEHEEWFEMSPPTMYSIDKTYFKSGSLQRHTSATAEHKKRIGIFCMKRLAGSAYPISRFYPDVFETVHSGMNRDEYPELS